MNSLLIVQTATITFTPDVIVLSIVKEVIQPHLPVRLPCYDFTHVTSSAASNKTNSKGVDIINLEKLFGFF
jgi:hypothetical protein